MAKYYEEETETVNLYSRGKLIQLDSTLTSKKLVWFFVSKQTTVNTINFYWASTAARELIAQMADQPCSIVSRRCEGVARPRESLKKLKSHQRSR